MHVLGRSLHDFFVALGGAQLDWTATAAELVSRAEFTINRVAVRQKPDKLVSLHLRSVGGRGNAWVKVWISAWWGAHRQPRGGAAEAGRAGVAAPQVCGPSGIK